MEPLENSKGKPEATLNIGAKFFFCKGKYAIDKKCIGLPFTLLTLVYNLVHMNYLLYKLTDHDFSYYITVIISILFFIFELFFLLKTAFRNPGAFLPDYETDISNSSEASLMIATIKGQDYFLKFCRTCNIPRDLRVYHCPLCGICVLRHDHHCPWLSTCIGLNNHRLFFEFVVVTFFYFIFTSCVYLSLIDFTKEYFQNLDVHKIFVVILFSLNVITFCFTAVLLMSHIRYISTGQTTSEHIKRPKGAINPYTLDNCKDNQIEFWKYPMKYKERVEYNKNASLFLDKILLIEDYMSGSYHYDKNNKVISNIYDINGYHYTKSSVEMANASEILDSDENNNMTNTTEEKSSNNENININKDEPNSINNGNSML